MKEILKTLNDHGVGSYEEKRSQFIACSAPISSEEEALTFIKDMKGWHKRRTIMFMPIPYMTTRIP